MCIEAVPIQNSHPIQVFLSSQPYKLWNWTEKCWLSRVNKHLLQPPTTYMWWCDTAWITVSQSVRPSDCLSVCLTACLSARLTACLPARPSASLLVSPHASHLAPRLPPCLTPRLPPCLAPRLPPCLPPPCLFAWLPACLSVLSVVLSVRSPVHSYIPPSICLCGFLYLILFFITIMGTIVRVVVLLSEIKQNLYDHIQ